MIGVRSGHRWKNDLGHVGYPVVRPGDLRWRVSNLASVQSCNRDAAEILGREARGR